MHTLPVLYVISMACSYSGGPRVSVSFRSSRCPGLRKTMCNLVNIEGTTKNHKRVWKMQTYCNHNHHHIHNMERNSRSCHSHRNHHIPAGHRNHHSLGSHSPGSSSCYIPGSSSGFGLRKQMLQVQTGFNNAGVAETHKARRLPPRPLPRPPNPPRVPYCCCW